MSTTGRDRRWGARSGAGWSQRGDEPDAGDAHPLAIASEERYVDREVAGVGGMGTVMVADDRRLGRAVALKRIAVDGDDPAAAARLAREAAITARLEHPSIVPIYDAGIGADGRAYYAMRLVRGRSLADALTEAGNLDARLALVRPFLAVCQAMAYAHRHAVVHRDLKPANIMIGEFGEVHVVDWGLAEDLGEPERVGDPGAGTPCYLAPERLRGEPATAAADVWALGAILGELMLGRPLLPPGRLELLALWADRGPIPSAWPERAPPELVAIAEKALATEPDARYPDAGPLAADVSAFLDGRRVGAHAYSTAELARRLIRAWRWQLAAVGAAVVTGGLVLGLMYTRIEGQRARALSAERRATAALIETRATLSLALERSAVAALLAGDIAEAEQFAADALEHGESVDARGVLAATRAGGRPVAAERVDPPPCGQITPDDADGFLCHDGEWLSLWSAGASTPRWRVRAPAVRVSSIIGGPIFALERGVAVSAFARADGRALGRVEVPMLTDQFARSPDGRRVAVMSQRELLLLAMTDDGLTSRPTRPCGVIPVDAAALAADVEYVICRDGRVKVYAGDAARELAVTGYGSAQRPATALAVDRDQRVLAIGGIDGELTLLELSTGRLTGPRPVLDEPIRAIGMLGELVAVAGERGGIRVWGRSLDAELVRLPDRAGPRLEIVGDTLLSGGTSWWRWRLPPSPSPRRYEAPAGLSGAAVSPDGSQVAVARGDGVVSLWATRLGRKRADLPLSADVVKRVAFSPDGAALAAVIAGRAQEVVLAVADQQVRTIASSGSLTGGALRVAFLRDGTRLVVPYLHLLIEVAADGTRHDHPAQTFADLEVTPSGDAAWLLGRDGSLWRFRDGALERRFAITNAFTVAPLSDDQIVVSGPGRVAIYDADGAVVKTLQATTEVLTDVAVSPDGRFIAASAGSGLVEVWAVADGRLVARLRGHRTRAPWVGFAAGALWSASWDGSLLRWDVGALSQDAASLSREAATAWALR